MIIAIITTSIFYGQEEIPLVEYNQILERLYELEEKEDYEGILTELDKISVNDSIYTANLVTKSYYLLQLEKYDEVVAICDQGLQAEDTTEQYSFYLNKGLAFIQAEKYPQAIEVYTNALKHYPKNNVLYHNLGYIYQKMEQWEKALQNYKQSVMLNPFYAKSHLEIGKLSFKEGQIAQALMAFNLYLILNPDGENSFSVLNLVNNLVSQKNDIEALDITISEDDETFEDIDLVLDSRMAMNKDFKLNNKINIGLTRQNQALLEQLQDYEGNGGFWDRKYVPFFNWITENNHFDAFTYTISYSIQNKDFKKIVDKNVEEITSFIDVAYDKWQAIMEADNEEVFEGKKQKVTYAYENYNFLQAVGIMKEGKKIGNWEVYDEKGKRIGNGKFNEDGVRTGDWQWYDASGNISESEHYKDGKLEGQYTYFYKNGNKEIECNYVAGELNGDYKKYNDKGALIEHKQFKNGVLDGKYLSYHKIGERAKDYELMYKDGKPVGELRQYYVDGSLFKKHSFLDGKVNGTEKLYYHTGELMGEYEYKEGLYNGPYVSYYRNGQKSEEGVTAQGYYDGNWKLYHRNGALMNAITYKKGELNEAYLEYDLDGKLHYDFTYRNDEFIAFKYYNKNKEIIGEGRKKKGEFYYKGYDPLGSLVTEGLYDIKGGKVGEWKYYSEEYMTNKVPYEDNKVQGDNYNYYRSGKEESITPYKNDSIHGYYRRYHENGALAEHGWYQKNLIYGDWKSYYPDGTLKRENFYHKGKQHGTQKFYGVEGKLLSTSMYAYGNIVSEKKYHPDGSVLQEVTYDPTKESYTVSIKGYNGKTQSTTEYVYGVKNGKYTKYNTDGKIVIEGSFLNDRPHDSWTWYYDSGEINRKGHYFHGEYDQTWTSYHENGTINEKFSYESGKLNGVYESYNEEGILIRKIPYIDDKMYGEREFYSPEGKLQVVRYYHLDNIIGYSYHDKEGKLLPMIPIDNYSGKLQAYFDNGKPSMEGEFKNGVLVNQFKAYYYSGQLERISENKYGNIDGKYTKYYADGKVKEEMTYDHGLLNGVYKKYHPNGKIKEEVIYRQNERSGKALYYDKAGKLTKEKVYYNDVATK
ncbi:hypothetical protein GCM10009430_05560 [Aquimarina litoralis]|uniref:Antitoxin component YwqK of the YwqJK toxin-antitoxin module n=1 Tax=Aquimarina litoralis TaxID=584605 RepID=A0ABP3TNE1_9FLAO